MPTPKEIQSVKYDRLFALKMEYVDIATRIEAHVKGGLPIPGTYTRRLAELERMVTNETTEVILHEVIRWKFIRFIMRPFTRAIVANYYNIHKVRK